MDVRLMSELLFLRARWRGRDRWDARRIVAHQERALGDLRRAAYAGSEFYRRHHAGLYDAPLAQLPPVTKTDLMNSFDQTVTVPGLRLADVPVGLTRPLRVGMVSDFQPRLLVGYASVLRTLAAEQRPGRLNIGPQSVMSASEVLSEHDAAEMLSAWGSTPFDVYAATETAGIASPCSFHRRHIYEDLVIVEPVDQGGVPVQPGTVGAR
jgi:phenylacetate-coenzyme A ligase PaaK-like adenylate-forming protein